MNRISRSINDFFRWWGRELAFLVPEKLRLIFNEKRGQLVLIPEDEWLTVVLKRDEQSEVLTRLPLNELGEAEYLDLAAKDERIKNTDVIIRLSRQDAVSRTLFLPAAVAENLEQVLAYELDKYTPFTPEQVYYAVKRLDRDEISGMIKVLLVLTPREKLEQIYREIREWDVTPLLADFMDAPNDFEHDSEPYNLLPDWARIKQNVLTRVLNISLALVFIVLLCAVLIVPVWMQYQTTESLRSEIRLLGKDAEKVEELRSNADQLQGETELLIKTKREAPAVVKMLDTLSKLIADDTWLTHFQFSAGKLQIQGQSPNASSLIGVLESSPLFANVRFVSPVTQDKRTGLERFQITARIDTSGGAPHADQ